MKIIQALLLKPSNRSDGNFHDGLINSSYHVQRVLNDLEDHDWIQEGGFSNGFYRSVWINISDRQVLTYCEGDLILKTCENTVDFYSHLQETALFYRDN